MKRDVTRQPCGALAKSRAAFTAHSFSQLQKRLSLSPAPADLSELRRGTSIHSRLGLTVGQLRAGFDPQISNEKKMMKMKIRTTNGTEFRPPPLDD